MTDVAEFDDARQRWFPLCGLHDLPPRHVFEAQLLGRELAVWRGAEGTLNVWENRCPHRGMRFTVGTNLGGELRCAYHGYRFASGTGRCTAVPAQPGRTPPRSVCARVFPVLERNGLIWTRVGDDASGYAPGAGNSADPTSDARAGGTAGGAAPLLRAGVTTALYGVVVAASAPAVAAALAHYRFRASAVLDRPVGADEHCSTSVIDEYGVRSAAGCADLTTEVCFFLQPVDAQCTVIHGVVLGGLPEALTGPTLRHHAALLAGLRDEVELRTSAAGPASQVPTRDFAAAAGPAPPVLPP